eukprot:UN05434
MYCMSHSISIFVFDWITIFAIVLTSSQPIMLLYEDRYDYCYSNLHKVLIYFLFLRYNFLQLTALFSIQLLEFPSVPFFPFFLF